MPCYKLVFLPFVGFFWSASFVRSAGCLQGSFFPVSARIFSFAFRFFPGASTILFCLPFFCCGPEEDSSFRCLFGGFSGFYFMVRLRSQVSPLFLRIVFSARFFFPLFAGGSARPHFPLLRLRASPIREPNALAPGGSIIRDFFHLSCRRDILYSSPTLPCDL